MASAERSVLFLCPKGGADDRGNKELLKIYLCKIPCQELASMLLLSRDYNYFEG